MICLRQPQVNIKRASPGGGRAGKCGNLVVGICQERLPACVTISIELLLRSDMPPCWQRHHNNHMLRGELEDSHTTLEPLLFHVGSNPHALHLVNARPIFCRHVCAQTILLRENLCPLIVPISCRCPPVGRQHRCRTRGDISTVGVSERSTLLEGSLVNHLLVRYSAGVHTHPL